MYVLSEDLDADGGKGFPNIKKRISTPRHAKPGDKHAMSTWGCKRDSHCFECVVARTYICSCNVSNREI